MTGSRRQPAPLLGSSSRPPHSPTLPVRGFTLLELIVANVIIVILLGALLIALRVIGKQQQLAGDSARPPDPSQEAIVSLFRRDLANSRRMWHYPDGNGIVLSGYASLDRRGGFAPTGRLCRVHYRVGNNGTLLRTEEPLDADRTGGRPWAELVCCDVAAFDVQFTYEPGEQPPPPPPATDGATSAARGEPGLPIASRATLLLRSAGKSPKDISEELWLR